jgi:hypothetical protein
MKNYVSQRRVKHINVQPKTDKLFTLNIFLIDGRMKILHISNLDFFLQEFDDAQKVKFQLKFKFFFLFPS